MGLLRGLGPLPPVHGGWWSGRIGRRGNISPLSIFVAGCPAEAGLRGGEGVGPPMPGIATVDALWRPASWDGHPPRRRGGRGGEGNFAPMLLAPFFPGPRRGRGGGGGGTR